MTATESYHDQHTLGDRLTSIDGSARVAVLARALRETEFVNTDCGYGAGKRRAPIIETAVLLSYVVFMQGKGTIMPGWMWQDTAQIEEETGLWEHAQRKARQFAEELGWLQTYYHRLSHRMYYRVLLEADDFGELVESLLTEVESKRDARRNVSAERSRNVSADRSGTVSADKSRNASTERSRTVSADGSIYRANVSTNETTNGRTNTSSSRAAEKEEKAAPAVDGDKQTPSLPGTETLLEDSAADIQNAPDTLTKEFHKTLERDEPEIAACLPILHGIEGWPTGPEADKKTAQALRKYTAEFPDVDPPALCDLFADWHLDNPMKKNANPRSRLRTWFSKDREYGGRASRNRPSPDRVPLNGNRKGEAPVYGVGGANRPSFAERMRAKRIRSVDPETGEPRHHDAEPRKDGTGRSDRPSFAERMRAKHL